MAETMYGLRFRLCVFLLVTAVPALAVITAAALHRFDQERSNAVVQLQRQLDLVVFGYGEILSDSEQMLRAIAAEPEVRGFLSDPDSCIARVKRAVNLNNQYAYIGVANAMGEVVCPSGSLSQAVTVSDRVWFNRVKEAGDFIIGDYEVGRASGRPSLHVAFPVIGPDGAFVGAVNAALELEWLNRRLSRLGLPSDATVLLMDSSRNVLASHPGSAYIGKQLPLEAPLQPARQPHSMQFFGTHYLVIHAPVGVGESTQQLRALLGVPRDSLLLPVWQQTNNSLLVLLTVLALALLSSLYALNYLVIRPLRQLRSHAVKLTSGDLSAKVDVSSLQNTELVQLGEVFNSMADSLKKTHSALREANAWKSRLLAVASHDLRQPLQTLELTLALLAHQTDEEKKAKSLKRAGDAIEELRRQVNRLSAVVKLDKLSETLTPEIRAHALGPMLRELESYFRSVADEQGIRLRVVVPKLVVETDPDWLETILHNLVDNALKYTSHGGKVLIGCRRGRRTCRIEVRDNGIGIPPGKLSEIFQAFYRTGDLEREGLGLGLSIVKSASDALGYKLRVVSQPGKGTCFSVEVPIAETARAESRSEA